MDLTEIIKFSIEKGVNALVDNKDSMAVLILAIYGGVSISIAILTRVFQGGIVPIIYFIVYLIGGVKFIFQKIKKRKQR